MPLFFSSPLLGQLSVPGIKKKGSSPTVTWTLLNLKPNSLRVPGLCSSCTWTHLPCRSEQVSSRRVGAGGPGPLLSSEQNWGSLSSNRNCSARTDWPAQGSRSGRRSGMGKRSLRVARGAESRNTVCCSVACGGSVCGRAGGQSCHREFQCLLPPPAVQNQQAAH